MTVKVLRHQFTVEQYERMYESGVFTEDDRVELIQGEIIIMAAIGSRHAGCVNRLNELSVTRLSGRAIVTVQNPIRLEPDSEPQPDVVWLRPRADYYSNAHPGPADILLVVEVADTTIDYDRGVKIPLYARSGILEVWLDDLTSDRVEAYWEPSSEGYRRQVSYQRHQQISPQAYPDLQFSIDDILG
ncbi:MAG: Uma2 family endonuclease [Candidatus Tectomicrobia bacterium]|nr:Uma2 family endonuclease [Candidatus Tectomicrobia bacterium]